MTDPASRRRSDAGLSLAEALVIVVLIATLAAVVLPLYLGQARAAKDAAAEADALDLGDRLTQEYGDGTEAVSVTATNGWYLINGEPTLETSPGVEVSYFESDQSGQWCLELRHPAGDKANAPGVRLRAGQDEVEFARCPVPSRSA